MMFTAGETTDTSSGGRIALTGGSSTTRSSGNIVLLTQNAGNNGVSGALSFASGTTSSGNSGSIS